MTDTKQPEDRQVPAIQRYKIGYHADEWGQRSSTPSGILDASGSWVRYADHVTALAAWQATAAQQPGAAYAALPVTPQFPAHPEPMVMDWSAIEISVIAQYGRDMYEAGKRASHGQAPAGAMLDVDIDAIALARYKVAPSHESMFHRFSVVAGDGEQHLYFGRETECQNMARKFVGAFLDGAFYQSQAKVPTPSPHAEDTQQAPAQAAPAVVAGPALDFADAYEGAREDLAIWKHRALAAERDLRAEQETSSRLAAEINALNGPTRMGEPAAVAGCTRSHPHENMGNACRAKAALAEMRSKAARGAEATAHDLDRFVALLTAKPTTQPAPQHQARPVTPYTCPKCSALWLHWPAEQSGFGRDTLNCRSTTHCDYCEKGGVEQLRRLERVPAVLAAPQQEASPTAGMNIAQRILHVGGRNNAAGYDDEYRAMVAQGIKNHE